MPTEGSWAWSYPYVPAGGPHAFRAVTAGPGFSFYAAGDDWSSQWVVNRVDCGADTEGFTDWTDTRTGPDGAGASAMFIATDRAKNLYVVGTDQTHGGDIYLVKYDPDGTVLWQKSWDGPTHLADRPEGLAVTRPAPSSSRSHRQGRRLRRRRPAQVHDRREAQVEVRHDDRPDTTRSGPSRSTRTATPTSPGRAAATWASGRW